MCRREIEVEIEQTMQSVFFSHGHLRPVYSKIETQKMKLKKEYVLAFGACLQIDDILANGCTYEEYAYEVNRQLEPPAQDLPRTIGFAKWNEKVSACVPYPPLDVICHLYVTFKMSKAEKQPLPGTEFLLSEKKPLPREDEKWICPVCGATNTISAFCSNCGTARERKVVAKSNICYFDAKGEVCEKENAVTCIISEYDEDGNLLNSMHGFINDSQNLKYNNVNNIVEEPNDDETMWLCPSCGTFNKFENKYCVKCGHQR